MCRGTVLRAWQARCLAELAKVPAIELALLIIDDRGRSERGSRSWSTALWDAYNNRYVARRSRALRPVDLTDALELVPSISCRIEKRGRYSEHFLTKDLDAIRSHDLDFVLRFGFGIIRGEILDVPRFGVWSFHHDDEERYRGGPPAFWELANREPVTGAVLQRLTDRLDGGIVLCKGHFRTVAHSYVRNTDEVHLGSAEWPAKVCRDLQAGVADYVNAPPTGSEAPIYRKPTNWRMARFLARLAIRFLGAQVRRLTVADQWNVGIVDEPIRRFVEPAFRPAVEWRAPASDTSKYVADPFGVADGDGYVTLVESYDYRSRIGTIDWVSSDGRPSEQGRALQLDHHASYPFVLQHDGETYCVPQLAGSAGVHIYRAMSFPTHWELAAVCADEVRALDPTIVEHEGQWWLFCTDARDGSLTKLRVWWADALLGPWRPHSGNPVKTDVRSARPAGTPFHHDGALFRPAQDCSRTYGGAVALNRVLELTPTTFREETVNVIEPISDSRYDRGLHTLAAMGERTLVDGKRLVFNRHAALSELRATFRRRERA